MKKSQPDVKIANLTLPQFASRLITKMLLIGNSRKLQVFPVRLYDMITVVSVIGQDVKSASDVQFCIPYVTNIGTEITKTYTSN